MLLELIILAVILVGASVFFALNKTPKPVKTTKSEPTKTVPKTPVPEPKTKTTTAPTTTSTPSAPAQPKASAPKKAEPAPKAAPKKAEAAPAPKKKKKPAKKAQKVEEAEVDTSVIAEAEEFVRPKDPTVAPPKKDKKKKAKEEEKKAPAPAPAPVKAAPTKPVFEAPVSGVVASSDGFEAPKVRPKKVKAEEVEKPAKVEKIEMPTEKAPAKIKPVYYSDVEFWATKIKELESRPVPSKEEQAAKAAGPKKAKAAKAAPVATVRTVPAGINPWQKTEGVAASALDTEDFPSLQAAGKKRKKKAVPKREEAAQPSEKEALQSQEGSDVEQEEYEDDMIDTETVQVTFVLKGISEPGVEVRVAGNTEDLGSWSFVAAPALVRKDDVYSVTANVPLKEGQTLEYKYCTITDGQAVWEGGDNRSLDLTEGHLEAVDEWRGA